MAADRLQQKGKNMTKVDIVSGFLGAGKTTLIKKLIGDALAGTKVVLIENEFGEIGIDGGFLKDAGIEIREMNSGCICCSLVGDFNASLKQVMENYDPERIIIEPSGVGKLDDVMRAIEKTADEIPGMKLNSAVTVVDATKARVYFKNFGEFFVNQIENAGTVILTRTDKASQDKIDEAVALIREHNAKATIITTPLAELDGKKVLETIEGGEDLQSEILAEVLAGEEEHHHHHHHDEHAEKYTDEDGNTVYRAHHHHHDHEDEDHDHEEHEHCCHHHDHEEDHDHEEHEHCCHHHDHEEDHDHEEHEHHHHHDHDADEVFESWGMETPHTYTAEEVTNILTALDDNEQYGFVLRSKGMLPAGDGTWIHFDYVPGEPQVRCGAADVTGKICVIGSGLNQDNLEKLFKRK
jgi:G3E family GTPase